MIPISGAFSLIREIFGNILQIIRDFQQLSIPEMLAYNTFCEIYKW